MAKERSSRSLSNDNLANFTRPVTKANEAMHPVVMSEAAFTSKRLRDAAYYADDTVLVLNMDVREGIKLLAEAGVEVNCVVTSPPFYGQRDYEVDRQIGLEPHPSEFISLRLNDDDNYVQERCNILMDFVRADVSADFLQRRYPFLAKEVARQQLSQEDLRTLFRI
jgi:hypothetical protein